MLKRYVPFLVACCALTVFAPSAIAESFGVRRFSVAAVNQNGTPDVQAGSHPYALTTTFTLNEPRKREESEVLLQEGGLKDARLELPPGFVGDPTATPRCAYRAFIVHQCPNETAVGMETTYILEETHVTRVSNAVYNIDPSPGTPVELAFKVKGQVPVFLNASVRTGGDYGVTVNVPNISEATAVYASKVTIWGVPSEHSHDSLRGNCLGEDEEFNEEGLGEGEDELEGPAVSGGECPVGVPVRPFLTNPTSCGVPRTARLSVDDWENPGNFSTGENVISKTAALPALSGCEKLDFRPTLDVTPDGVAGSTPTGLNIDVHLPQEATANPVGLGEADMKDATVTLPAGVQLNPSAADGLLACSPAQIGFTGVNPQSGADEFTPGPASCPNAAKVATARIKTPLLEEELEGAVYLAAPQNFPGPLENPFGSLVAMYLVAEAPTAGILVKLAGKITLSPETGQLTATVEQIPQFPVSDVKFRFFGSDRAPLGTPALCGTYTTETSFAPWSATTAVNPSSSFPITAGPGGSPCASPLPFGPSLSAGTTNINAGSFSPLTTTISREDGQQSLFSVQLHMPPGLSGLLSGVKLCGEAEANAGSCGPQSEIGETIVSVGLGNDPFTVTGGKVYITGPYEGAPFGLSIVNPAKAGPFVLQQGRPVVVRAKIEVDPTTAALTITTDSSGPHRIPTIIDGIPLQIKHVNVLVNRPNFSFNPTNCDPLAVTGTIASAQGGSAPQSIPFQVTNCANLKFQPSVAVRTKGKASRLNGASLIFKIAYPKGALGTQSWFQEAKFSIPKQLPARLTTIQQACLAATFERDRSACPAHSIIGHAVVHTPVLPVPLQGSVYFVSYGGAAFPDAVVVLDGYGVHIELHGNTFINGKTGVTSATFKNTPDVPFESIEVSIPTGPFSEFGANLPASAHGSFCGQKLVMPTLFKAQNGLEIHKNTTVGVTGCPKAKSRIQKLAAALKACHNKHGAKRTNCEHTAHRRYRKK